MNRSKIISHGKLYQRCQRGTALIEFALVLPFLLILLIGVIEITRMMLIYQKIDNATSNIADVITRMNYEQVPCSGPFGLKTLLTDTLPEMIRPYDFAGNGGALIVSAVEARYPNPNDASDDEPLEQRIAWQWNTSGYASRIGHAKGNAGGSEWPVVFSAAPNKGGMFNGDRIIVVEVYYTYRTLIPAANAFLDLEDTALVYKNAFYRARFGNMASLGRDCPKS